MPVALCRWLCAGGFVPVVLGRQASSLAVLSQLADNFAMRREMFKEDWVSPLVAAMNANQTNDTEIWVDYGGG